MIDDFRRRQLEKRIDYFAWPGFWWKRDFVDQTLEVSPYSSMCPGFRDGNDDGHWYQSDGGICVYCFDVEQRRL